MTKIFELMAYFQVKIKKNKFDLNLSIAMIRPIWITYVALSRCRIAAFISIWFFPFTLSSGICFQIANNVVFWFVAIFFEIRRSNLASILFSLIKCSSFFFVKFIPNLYSLKCLWILCKLDFRLYLSRFVIDTSSWYVLYVDYKRVVPMKWFLIARELRLKSLKCHYVLELIHLARGYYSLLHSSPHFFVRLLLMLNRPLSLNHFYFLNNYMQYFSWVFIEISLFFLICCTLIFT